MIIKNLSIIWAVSRNVFSTYAGEIHGLVYRPPNFAVESAAVEHLGE